MPDLQDLPDLAEGPRQIQDCGAVFAFRSTMTSRTIGNMPDRTITLTEDEYEAVITALDTTAARYEEIAKKEPHMIERARKMRDAYRSLVRYMGDLRPGGEPGPM